MTAFTLALIEAVNLEALKRGEPLVTEVPMQDIELYFRMTIELERWTK